MSDVGSGLLIALLVIVVALASPMLALWGLNTIAEQSKFAWHIPHNLWTYLAVWALVAVFAASAHSSD